MLDKSPQKIVGEIYLKTSEDEKYLIYGKNYSEDGIYGWVIDEPIVSLVGNDSLIYIKSNFLDKTKYYIVYHLEGKIIVKVTAIDSIKYTKLRGKPFKYKFEKTSKFLKLKCSGQH